MAMRPSTKMQLAKMAREPERQPGRKMEIEYETWGNPEQRYDKQLRGNWREPRSMGNYSPESRDGESRMNYGEDAEMRRGRRGGYRGARSGWDDEMGMEMEMRQEGGGRGNRGGGNRGGARSDMDMMMGRYEAESRFRDRRGREHYDNGRFAPMRSDYFPDGPYMEPERPFGPMQRGGDDMRQIGFNSNWDGGEMRMAADATVPRYQEMERMPGDRPMMGGYMAQHQHRKLDEQTANEWVRGMKNEDGSKSPHWTMEQVKQVAKQKGLDKEIEPVELFAVLNALFSDYDPIFKKHGVSNMEFYVDMAKAWIQDKDAVPNKTMAYYECIVK